MAYPHEEIFLVTITLFVVVVVFVVVAKERDHVSMEPRLLTGPMFRHKAIHE
jgi:hypothetical protein